MTCWQSRAACCGTSRPAAPTRLKSRSMESRSPPRCSTRCRRCGTRTDATIRTASQIPGGGCCFTARITPPMGRRAAATRCGPTRDRRIGTSGTSPRCSAGIGLRTWSFETPSMSAVHPSSCGCCRRTCTSWLIAPSGAAQPLVQGPRRAPGLPHHRRRPPSRRSAAASCRDWPTP